MAKELKKVMSFRFSQTTINELNQLAQRHKITQARLLAILVHFAYVGEDVDQLENWLDVARLN